MKQEYDNTNKGALWLRTSQKGLKYMSGTLNVEGTEYDIAMFKNEKQNEKAPDYRINVKAKVEIKVEQDPTKLTDEDVYATFGKQEETDDENNPDFLPF